MVIKNLTLKIQGQGQGWGQSFKSQLGSNIPSDSVGNSHRSASPRSTTLEEDWELFVDFPSIQCLWFEIQAMRTYNFLTEFPTLHPMDSYPCMSIHPLIPTIELFLKIWPSKSKVKVIAQGHIIGITSYRLASLWFHVNRPSHSRDTAFFKFDRENPRSRS